MRIFLAGASGVIGRRLVGPLIAAGHEVTGMTRDESRAASLRAVGAQAVIADALDGARLSHVVAEARPEVVIHQLTAIPARIRPRRMATDFELNDRLRTEGTANLIAAARAGGARRLVAQSIAFAYAPGPPGLRDEDAPLFEDAPEPFRRSARAIATLERSVLGADGLEGVVLRYGYFYGPGSAYAADGSIAEAVRRRQMPVVGRGRGVWSFIHVDDAAAATVAAIADVAPGTYNVVDDEPAAVSQWLPVYAAVLGAPPPLRVPTLLARIIAGRWAVYTMTRAPGADNAKAKRELGWTPAHTSWRDGFPATVSAP